VPRESGISNGSGRLGTCSALASSQQPWNPIFGVCYGISARKVGF
jgi:hypothetical protein